MLGSGSVGLPRGESNVGSIGRSQGMGDLIVQIGFGILQVDRVLHLDAQELSIDYVLCFSCHIGSNQRIRLKLLEEGGSFWN